MIWGAEIGLLIYGVYVLIKGEFKVGKDRILFGVGARVCGACCLLPLPVSFALGLAFVLVLSLMGKAPELQTTYKWCLAGIEVGVLILTIVLVGVLSSQLYKRQERLDMEETGGAH